MGASRLAQVLERYRDAASWATLAEAFPGGATVVVDGNNLAYFLARGCASYDDLDAAVRRWAFRYGDDVIFVFDGPREDAATKAEELARRASERGEKASARLFEGVDACALGVLAVEQTRATLLDLFGPERCKMARGEADDAIAVYALSGGDRPRVIASDDCDFVLRGLALLRLADGRVYSRDRFAAAAFGPGARADAIVDVALLLGTEAVPAGVRVDADAAVTAVARGLAADGASFRVAFPEDPALDAAAAFQRAAYASPVDRGFRDNVLDASPVAPLAIVEALERSGAVAPRHALALRRVVAGERSRGTFGDRRPADVDAAYAFEARLREELRASRNWPEILAPAAVFDAQTFFALCAQKLNVSAAAFAPQAPPSADLDFETSFGRLDAGRDKGDSTSR